jgi:hypothetical protein
MTQDSNHSNQFTERLQYVQEHVQEEAAKHAIKLVETLGRLYFALRDAGLMKGVTLNGAVLVHACNAFYADIFRIEAFHPLHYAADDHKKAAHIFKWISRLRPIIPLVKDPKKMKGGAMSANSVFAMLCAFTLLKMRPFSPSPCELDHILYSSIYRDNQPQEWAMIFYLLEKWYTEADDSRNRIQRYISQDSVLSDSEKNSMTARLEKIPADKIKRLQATLLELWIENEPKARGVIKEFLS